MKNTGPDGGAAAEWLRALYERDTDGLALLAWRDGRVLAANPAFCRMVGRTHEDLRARSWRELTPPRWHELDERMLRGQVAERAHSEAYEKELLRADGGCLPVEVRAFLAPGAASGDDAVWAVVRDLTERRLAAPPPPASDTEELTRRSTELEALHALSREVGASLSLDRVVAAALNGMIRVTHADLAFLFTRVGERLILRGAEPASGRERMGLMPEHRVGECLCGLAARQGHPIYSRDIWADMRCTWEECKQAGFRSFAALPLRSSRRQIGVLGLASVSEREFGRQDTFLLTLAGVIAAGLENAQLHADLQQTAGVLERERQFSDSIVAGLPGVFYMFDENGRMIRWNRNFETVTGYSAEEVARRHPVDYFEGADRDLIAARIARVFAEGSANAEADFVFKGGGRAPYYFTGLRTLVDGKPCLIGVGIDVSERKQLQERLNHAERLGAIGRLAGGVAHDFNNQLTGILGYADLLCRDLRGSPLRSFAEGIMHSAQRAADLTRQLLVFGRKARRVSVPVDLHRVVNEVVGLLERSVDRRIRIQCRLAAGRSTILGDPTLLQNALLNLGINARDAMPQGGELAFETDSGDCDALHCSEVGCALRKCTCIRLAVRDTGVGMSEEVRRHAFEPFFTTKKPGEGTGMGLAGVWGAVQDHGGVVAIASEVGKGTTVRLCFTLHEAPSGPEAGGAAAPARGSAHVLVVDDEPAVRGVVTAGLRDLGCRVTALASGREAVAWYREHSGDVDLVILDLIMPEMSGRDTFVELRRIRPDARVLVSSGYSPDGAGEELLQAGARGFVGKPFRIDDLARHVAASLKP